MAGALACEIFKTVTEREEKEQHRTFRPLIDDPRTDGGHQHEKIDIESEAAQLSKRADRNAPATRCARHPQQHARNGIARSKARRKDTRDQ
jgi:hypothetical protein